MRRGLTHGIVCLRRLESYLKDPVLSFPTVDPRDQTLGVRIGGKPLYPLSPLTGPYFILMDAFFTLEGGVSGHLEKLLLEI